MQGHSVRREDASSLWPGSSGGYSLFGSDCCLYASQISLQIDLTDIDHLTLDQLWLSPVQPNVNLVTVLVYWTDDEGVNHYSGRDRDGTSLIATEGDPRPNPDTRLFDLSGFTGMSTVFIQWNAFVCPAATAGILFDPCFGSHFTGWIDNVRFHPVPEPGTALLVASGLALLGSRRFVRSAGTGRRGAGAVQ